MNRLTQSVSNGIASATRFLLRMPTWGLLLLSGGLLGLAFPPNRLGPLFGAIGLVPLIIALERSTSIGQSIRRSYVAFLYFSAISTWWVGSWQSNADPWLMTSSMLLVIVHPLFFVVPMALYHVVRKRAPLHIALLFLVLLWTGGEYLHAVSDASYPWLTLGNAQTYNLPYIQFIELTGIWGASLLMLAQNGIVAWLVLRFATAETTASTAEIAAWGAVRTRGTTMLLGTIILPYLLGIAMTIGRDFTDGGTIRITVVQPNQNPWDKWRQDDTVDHIVDNAGPTIEAIRAGENPQMVLWAENAIPYTITHPDSKRKREEFTRVLREIGVPVVTGFPDYVVHASKAAAAPSSRYDEREKIYFDYYNSIGIFTAEGGLIDSYHKTQLVPFGERVPFIDAAPFLADMLSWDVGISAWAKGKSVHAITLPGDSIKLGGMICFESVYPNIVRKFVADSARFLTIVTNDGWYLHTPGPLQHERYATLRAVETRRSIARAANTGISCFILPTGEIVGETAEGVRTTTTATIPLNSMQTFYVRFGNWLPILCLFGAFCIGVLLVKRRGNWRIAETAPSVPSAPESGAPESGPPPSPLPDGTASDKKKPDGSE